MPYQVTHFDDMFSVCCVPLTVVRCGLFLYQQVRIQKDHQEAG